MFYLKELLFIIRDHKTLAMANLAFLALFTCAAQFSSDIKGFFALDSKTSSAPYFNALVGSATNADYIVRKMSNLPGVSAVEVKNSDKLAEEVSGFLEEVGAGPEVMAKSYNAFKVVLEPGTRGSSRELIREYFARLTGKKDVTFSQVKTPTPQRFKTSPLYGIFSKWSDVYLAALAGFGWLFTLWLISQPLCAQSFVIERFQRKDRTALKMYAWLWALPLLGLGMAAALFEVKIALFALVLGAILLVMGSLFFLKKGKSPQRFI